MPVQHNGAIMDGFTEIVWSGPELHDVTMRGGLLEARGIPCRLTRTPDRYAYLIRVRPADSKRAAEAMESVINV